MDDFVPNEDDYIELVADEAREISWNEWRESRYAEPITDPTELDLSGTAYTDAWWAGREYERSESQAKIRHLESLLSQAFDLVEFNQKSARSALDLFK